VRSQERKLQYSGYEKKKKKKAFTFEFVELGSGGG
jgi:hypothetical protein